MKSSFLRPVMALALVLGLSACGGGKATFTVSGSVDGLVHPGLVLTTNGAELAVAGGATTYAFPNQLEYGDVYKVEIKTHPQHQNCEVNERYQSDTAGRMASINVPVYCYLNTFSVGGQVSGLTTDGLVLANGTSGGTVTVAKGATTFAFPTLVPYGSSYGVTVLTQPAGQVCTVSNGVGEMGDAKVESVLVNCTTSIGG